MSKKQKTDKGDYIIIKGAKTHNLKNISIEIPKNKFIVFTGVSGSGKSSLVMDTLFAEGQRRYAESLNSYARQFLMRMQKPEVDYILNLSPAIAINQKISTNTNARSTVGTMTEIYEYIKLLYARIGETFSPITDEKVVAHNAESILEEVKKFEVGDKFFIAINLIFKNEQDAKIKLENYLKKGFSRIYLQHEIKLIEEILEQKNIEIEDAYFLIIDRFIKKNFDEDELTRLADSIENALHEGHNEMSVILEGLVIPFSNRFEADGIKFEPPSLNLFSFNNSYGACKDCEGHGIAYDVNLDLVLPNKNLTIANNAIDILKTPEMFHYKQSLISEATKYDIDVNKAIKDFSNDEMRRFLNGKKCFIGLWGLIDMLKKDTYNIKFQGLLSKYKSKTNCLQCMGTRLRKEALYVKVENKNIEEIVKLPISNLYDWFLKLSLNETKNKIASRILVEIKNRLKTLNQVGLGYLTLNRNASSLSGGESQRIKLTLSLGSSLTESIYILDEPSIGLHASDTEKLIKILKDLQELGNTVIVIEHDEAIMKAADQIVDIGPFASYRGGEVVAQGTLQEIKEVPTSLTAKYLNKELQIKRETCKPNFKECITIKNVHQHNLKNINLSIPMDCFCVISGVSGSGKTSLVKHVLYPYMKQFFNYRQKTKGMYDSIVFNPNYINEVDMIDQNAIGRSSRSNPISYIGAFDAIRDIFASQSMSKQNGFFPGMFSYNVPGGRCEACEGEGEKTIEMQFLADVKLLCDECNGRRYKSNVLEIKYKDKNIAEVLDMTVDEAIEFFIAFPKVLPYFKALQDVGLGYIHIGQSSSTLSGGEAQRIKLATYLLKGSTIGKHLFIFDEPTTGLHFHDIEKLLQSFQALLNKGHSIIVIEHNIEVIKNADWVIELGPGAGDKGGNIVFEGSAIELKKCKASATAKYL